MNNNLIQLFSTYKSTAYYNNNLLKINFDWLQEKLSSEDLDELKSQIYAVLLENEEDVFINTIKYTWNLYKEISSEDT